MFVRNWYKARAAQMAEKSSEILGSNRRLPNMVTVDGTVHTATSGCVSADSYSYWISAMVSPQFSTDVSEIFKYTTGSNSSAYRKFSYGVFFGSGNTPATMEDYKLAGDTVIGCTYSYSLKKEYAEDGTYSKWTVVYTITNNNSEPVTIGEIGIFTCAAKEGGGSYGSYYSYNYPYLYERTVLESPITIPAGGVGQVTYSITENYLEP